MTTPEPCTNSYHTRRHMSTDLAPNPYGGGRAGKSLCRPMGISVSVWDEDGINDEIRKWDPRKAGQRLTLDGLPECKLCARAAAKLEGATP